MQRMAKLLQRGLGKLEEWLNRNLVEPSEVVSSALAAGFAGALSHSTGWK